jgi:hypothetical protein
MPAELDTTTSALPFPETICWAGHLRVDASLAIASRMAHADSQFVADSTR